MAIAAEASADASHNGDYALVQRAIAILTDRRDVPPGLDRLAAHLGVSPARVRRAFERWCGLSPMVVAENLTAEHIRDRLAASAAILDGNAAAAGRIHDFAVTIAATISDETRRRGVGLEVAYGWHVSPFGTALLMTTEGGLCGLAFADDDVPSSRRLALDKTSRQAALDDMMRRWPRARYRESPGETGTVAARIFGSPVTRPGDAVPVVLIGTPFDLSVWQTLLRIPMSNLVSYADLARHLGRPEASRAVGTANGRNPISFVVPCHRALRGDGTLGGYYWGLTRKRALIAWEAGRSKNITIRTI